MTENEVKNPLYPIYFVPEELLSSKVDFPKLPIELVEIKDKHKHKKKGKDFRNMLGESSYFIEERGITKKYYEAVVKSLSGLQDITLVEVTAVTETRLLVGAGLPLDNLGIFLEFPHGLPVIPGSSLKGFIRSYLRAELFQGSKCFQEYEELLFGSSGEEGFSGSVVFVGGFPVESESGFFDLDVLAPHYSKYYRNRGSIGPDDFKDDVKPVRYVVVKPGVTYKFLLLFRDFQKLPSTLFCRFISEFQRALKEYGVGYGISKGYGVFSSKGVKIIDETEGELMLRSC